MTALVPFQEPVSAEVEQLRRDDYERVSRYIAPGISENTRRAYESHLKQFSAFCADRQWNPLPASEGAVIAYLTWACSRPEPDRMRPSSAKAVKSAISVTHDRAGHPNPTKSQAVKDAMRNLEREFKGGRVRRAKAMIADDVRAVDALPRDELIDKRDVAIVWASYGGLLRRSEVSALDVEDMDRNRRGITVLTVRSSKTDQTGHGEQVELPTRAAEAIREWLDAAGIRHGPMFRQFAHGHVLPKRLSGQSMRLIIQKKTMQAGLGSGYSGHSGRRGAATEAKAQGISDIELKRQGRWKSMSALANYVDGEANTHPDVRAGLKTIDQVKEEAAQ